MAAHAVSPGGATYTVFSAHDGTGPRTWVGAPPATFTVRELDGVIHASVDKGCNGLTIAITLDETHITPTDGVLMTGMYCPGPKGEQEHWLRSFFAEPVEYTLDGPTLRLTAGDKTLQLNDLAGPETLAWSASICRFKHLHARQPPHSGGQWHWRPGATG